MQSISYKMRNWNIKCLISRQVFYMSNLIPQIKIPFHIHALRWWSLIYSKLAWASFPKLDEYQFLWVWRRLTNKVLLCAHRGSFYILHIPINEMADSLFHPHTWIIKCCEILSLSVSSVKLSLCGHRHLQDWWGMGGVSKERGGKETNWNRKMILKN